MRKDLFLFDCPKRFVLHEHNAKRAGLHYDLRIEYGDGKECQLKSFASRKILDLIKNHSKKIVLFEQPDHEVSWLTFEGELKPEQTKRGGYGAGTMKIVDEGKFKVISQTDTSFVLDFMGKKLKGSYAFVKPRELNSDEWLMLKSNKKLEKEDGPVATTANTVSTPYNSARYQNFPDENDDNKPFLLRTFFPKV